MAHKTLISGTAYSVTGGRDLIGGTGYGCKAGKTLIGGTAFTVPFSKGIPLNTITPGAILYLNESGSPVPFYIAKHDYESGLNGAGRTLVVRKNCYAQYKFGADYNTYAGSETDVWLNNAWLKLLDADVQAAISKTKFYYTPGNGNNTVTTLQRAAFLLSMTEFGYTNSNMNTEGVNLPISAKLRKATNNIGTYVVQWTRSPVANDSEAIYYMWILNAAGNTTAKIVTDYGWERPAFTLPGTFPVIQNPDGTYTLAV